MSELPVHRLAAFTTDPSGGNPAGVVLTTTLPDADTMQRVAAEVGYSETAFVAVDGTGWVVRYFAPTAEVDFCGHATIAAGVLLGRTYGASRYVLRTNAGVVPVDAGQRPDGAWTATLTSVETTHRPVGEPLLEGALRALGWQHAQLDPTIPAALAYAGAWHLVLAVRDRATLAGLDYGFEELRELMLGAGLTTLQLVWREDERRFHARDPFPVGGVVEDPATGAAAAAFGGYLRDARLVRTPIRLLIHQGHDMGRPSLLTVEVPPAGGVRVTGTAVPIDA